MGTISGENIRMLKIRIKKHDVPIILWCIGIFLFPYILRDRIIGSIGLINLFVYVGLLMAYSKHLLYTPLAISKKSICYKGVLQLSIIVLVMLLFYSRGNGWGILGKLRLLFAYVFPTLFIYLDFAKPSTVKNYSNKWFICLRVVCRILCLARTLDFFLDNALQKMFATLYASNTMHALIRGGRFVSYYGHSLNNTLLFLLLLAWTTVMKSIGMDSERNYLLDVAISLFGIAITGSKSGIMLAILLLLLCNIGLKKMKYVIAILLLFSVFYFSGIFDTVIDRILQGIAIGDLSSSRNTALERLLMDGTLKFDLLQGHLIDYTGTSMIAALEYPFLRWSYTVGVVFTCVLYIIDFIVPVGRIVLAKKWSSLICVLIIMAFVNGNNGISAYNDDMMIYAINIGLMTQVTFYEGCLNEKKD